MIAAVSCSLLEMAGNIRKIQIYAMSWLVATCLEKSYYVIPAVSGSLLEMAGNGWKWLKIQVYAMS